MAKFKTDQVLQLLETWKLGRGEILNLTYIFSYQYNLMHVKAMAVRDRSMYVNVLDCLFRRSYHTTGFANKSLLRYELSSLGHEAQQALIGELADAGRLW